MRARLCFEPLCMQTLPCPCPSWVGIDVLLRGNMVNILMHCLWRFKKWDNTIFLFFALQSLVVCVTYRKTLWISSCLYQMSEDTQELAFRTQIYVKMDFGVFTLHCYNLLVTGEIWSVVLQARCAQDCNLCCNQAWTPEILCSVNTDQKASAPSNNLHCKT